MDEDPVRQERTKLTASYLNTIAGSLFTAGVAAPIAAAVFVFTGAGARIDALTLVLGSAIFLACSVILHFAARALLKRLSP